MRRPIVVQHYDPVSAQHRPRRRDVLQHVRVAVRSIDVNEAGTEAAAATQVTGTVADGEFETPKTRPFIPVFKADKPFLFLIRDRHTGSILFLGRYVGPMSTAQP